MNGIKTLWLVKEEINNIIMPFEVVEKNRDHKWDVFTTEDTQVANSELLSMVFFNCMRTSVAVSQWFCIKISEASYLCYNFFSQLTLAVTLPAVCKCPKNIHVTKWPVQSSFLCGAISAKGFLCFKLLLWRQILCASAWCFSHQLSKYLDRVLCPPKYLSSENIKTIS